MTNPGRILASAFVLSIATGTILLMLPVASRPPGGAPPLTAAFTATSAVCVTGLVVVDTATYWTGFGQGVLLVLMQIGGLGVMTFASLLALLVVGRLGLRTRKLTEAETKTLTPGVLRRMLAGIVVFSLALEGVVWLVLALRFRLAYDISPSRALYLGLFHAVSAYNNAGFALWGDSLIRFAGDPWVVVPVAGALVLGGIGYPVVMELLSSRRPREWSLHTRVTLTATAVLLVIGPVSVLFTEWTNPWTLGGLDGSARWIAGWFSGITPRTAGFNVIDYGHADPATLLITDALMFVGGGSAGTAGGIKVTTIAVLIMAIVSEVRGDPDVDVFDRRISGQTVRQALAVAGLALTVIGAATLYLLEITALSLDQVLFEVVSALATVGLSTGITPELPAPAQIVLILLMFLGRVGPMTVATALALRTAPRHYRNPEARPIIG